MIRNLYFAPRLARRASEGESAHRLRVGLVSEPATGRGWLWLPMALLLGYLLFAHGCHGDEDNELFMRLQRTTVPGSREATQP
jgi:hypothetical protein